jgi:CDP-diacylglycerol--glycerol-3-phosphate 3-phosphatidyltransferase
MRLTANQVTLARLLLMPALCWTIYADESIRWWGLFLGILIGATDFVDGYLARKQGPTILGGLMDPIADKVFIAVTFVPYADRGWVPWGLVAALFLREYLVTALRSGFERRQRQLRSTYLSKVKTWTQMETLAIVMLLSLLQSHRALSIIFASLAIVPLLLGLVWMARGRFWPGAWVGVVMHGTFWAIFHFRGTADATLAIMWTCVALTWVSAFDYVAAAVAAIKEPTLFDLSRIVPAAALPLVGMAAVMHGSPPWAVMMVMAIEMAHGGLDNHLAHHGVAASWWVWGGRLLLVVGLIAAAWLVPEHATFLAALAAAVSFAGAALTFWSRRRYYIEPKLRDKTRAVAEAT